MPSNSSFNSSIFLRNFYDVFFAIILVEFHNQVLLLELPHLRVLSPRSDLERCGIGSLLDFRHIVRSLQPHIHCPVAYIPLHCILSVLVLVRWVTISLFCVVQMKANIDLSLSSTTFISLTYKAIFTWNWWFWFHVTISLTSRTKPSSNMDRLVVLDH